VKKWLLAACGVALLAAVAAWTPLRLGAYVVVGRSPHCPFPNAIRSGENLKDQVRVKDEILYASREIARDEHYEQYETPMGRYWVSHGSKFVLPYNLAEQKRGIYGTGPRDVQPGDIVLDCGANIGVFTRHALERGAAKVIAIEPAPENIECLRRNFASEIEAGKVVVYPKGVWDKDDRMTLHVDPHNSAADSVLIQREGSHGVEVPLTTIDKLAAELSLERVSFIKMDIEGAEPNAIRGGAGVIARFRPRLALSAYHAPDHPVAVPAAVRAVRADYTVECGPCAEANYGVRPDIIYFY